MPDTNNTAPALTSGETFILELAPIIPPVQVKIGNDFYNLRDASTMGLDERIEIMQMGMDAQKRFADIDNNATTEDIRGMIETMAEMSKKLVPDAPLDVLQRMPIEDHEKLSNYWKARAANFPTAPDRPTENRSARRKKK